jgi:hypothetical protein
MDTNGSSFFIQQLNKFKSGQRKKLNVQLLQKAKSYVKYSKVNSLPDISPIRNISKMNYV